MLKKALFGVLLLFTGHTVTAQQLDSYLTVDSLQVGDRFTYGLVLDRDRDYDNVIYPDSLDFGADLELLSVKHYRPNPYTDSLVYHLQFFAMEDVMLPPLEVKLIDSGDTVRVATPQELITFYSALDGDSFKPMKPIFAFAAVLWPWILGGALVLAVGYLLYRRFGKDSSSSEPTPSYKPKPFANPLKQLEQELHALKQDDTLREQRDFKTFYSRLGDAVRSYYEQLYNIPALESTTRELDRSLNQLMVDTELTRLTRELLREADMVKFAKYTPTLDEAYKALDKGEAFLEMARKIDGSRIQRLAQEHNRREQMRRSEHEGRPAMEQDTELGQQSEPNNKQEAAV